MDDERRRRGTKAEFVTVMALIAERDRDAYRALRAMGWENVRFELCSRKSN